MKFISSLLLILIATTCVAQETDDSKRIKRMLEELTEKADKSRAALESFRSKYGKRHPKIVQSEREIAKIAQSKTELAARYALLQLQAANSELHNHMAVLSKQAAEMQEMMALKIEKKLKSEYEMIHSHALAAIKIIQSKLEQKQTESKKDLSRLMESAKVDPKSTYEAYRKTLENSLESALHSRLIATENEKRAAQRAADIARAQLDKQLQIINRQKEQLEKSSKSKDDVITITGERNQVENTKKLFDSLLSETKVQREHMNKALEAAKAARERKSTPEVYLSELTKKIDAIVKGGVEKKLPAVETRLKNVESELSEIKLMLKKLLDAKK